MKRTLWRAGLMCPVVEPSIRDGAILVERGRVRAMGPAARLLTDTLGAEVREFEKAILVPGLVNAHVHLELTLLSIPRLPMSEWIVRLVREVRGWESDRFLASARAGVRESLAAGVTCVGDISLSGQSAAAVAEAGLRGVVFHEVLGLDPGRAGAVMAEHLPFLEGAQRGTAHPGVSPHAPYSTSLDLYELALSAAGERGWPAATHLAESPEEVRFLARGDGPFADMYKALRGPCEEYAPSGKNPVRHLAAAGLLAGLDLAVHCNQTDAEEWALLRRAGVSVCLCPRTAVFFGHPFADAEGMREAGLPLCLGTDSRASSPSLSPLEEAAALGEAAPSLSPDALLGMCTRAGAEALGVAGEGAGALTPGGAADFALIEPPGEAPLEAAGLFLPGAEVHLTAVGGEVAYPFPD
ncbi:MAG: amidohydrolase family protein [Nitrospinota bacterium]|nr:amidohydrolase family protein [Nitrospinota bacterium]